MPNGITKQEIYDNLYSYLSEELADMSDDINDLEQASFLRALDEMLNYQSGKKQPGTLQNDDARNVFNLVIPKLTGDESFRIAPNLPYGSAEMDSAFEKVYGYAKHQHERRAEDRWEHKMLSSSWSDIASEYAELIKNDIIARGGSKPSAEADAHAAEEALKVIVRNLQDMEFSEPSVAEDNEQAVIKLGDIALEHKLGMSIKAYHHHVSYTEVMGILRGIRDLPQKRLADEKIENEIRDQLYEDTPREVASEYAGFVRDKIMARHGSKALADRIAQTVQENLIPLANNFQHGNFKWMNYVEQNRQAYVNIGSQLNLLDLGVHFSLDPTPIKSGDIIDLLKQLRNLPELPRVQREAEAKVEEKPEVKVEAKAEPKPEVNAMDDAEIAMQKQIHTDTPQKIAGDYAKIIRSEIIARGGKPALAEQAAQEVDTGLVTLVYNLQHGNFSSAVEQNRSAFLRVGSMLNMLDLGPKLSTNPPPLKADDVWKVLRQIRDLPQMRPAAEKSEAKTEVKPEVKPEVNAEEAFQEKLRTVSPRQFAKDYAELVKNEIIARGGDENSAKMDSFAVENAVYTLMYNFQNSNLKQLSVIDANYDAFKKLQKLSKDNQLDLKFPSNYRQPKGEDIADIMKQIGDLPNMRSAAKEAEAKVENNAPGMTPDIRARYIRTTLTGLVAFNDPNMDPTQMEKLANTIANLSDYAMEQPNARADFVDKGLETLFQRYPDQAEALKTICTAEDLNLSQQERVREVLRICYMNEMNKLSPANFDKLSEFNPFTATQVPGVSKPAKQQEHHAQKQAQNNPMSL